ncbi:hypothetical protein IF690_12880 [Pseudomonas sp. SK3(2021)]|uniref:hypothetical protein n=1 Tax=Pseudomonas sp. SK3(2021) TaxID=2841064 RepID=UPI00192B5D0D|nr:hypothetical protein [Pseudomonas sp. SK3(2021)]QQZ44377.1 hypothetical protein IF690_12880 [Pseudomonas sp. SK3(2021)]
MPVYIGEYNAGDFFRFPSTGDKKTAVDMCDRIAECGNFVAGTQGLRFSGAGPQQSYANWEGRIYDESAKEEKSFRLDLQAKAVNFNAQSVIWSGTPPGAEVIASIDHLCQWQLQFGFKGDRLTKKNNAAIGNYRVNHKGAVAGVMLAMDHWITIDDFKNALQFSFDRNAGETGTGSCFAVLASSDRYVAPVPVAAASSSPKASYTCGNTYCEFKDQIQIAVFQTFPLKTKYIASGGISLMSPKCEGCYGNLTLKGDLDNAYLVTPTDRVFQITK